MTVLIIFVVLTVVFVACRVRSACGCGDALLGRPLLTTWLLAIASSVTTGTEPNKSWKTATFFDFCQGTLGDGGVNTYVAADGSVRLINLWDYNNDGNFDLPVSCPQDYNESVPLAIYWADAQGFSSDRCALLPTAGAMAVHAADLNEDGYTDLVVANNFDGEKTDLNSVIYWNSKQGFDPSRNTLLPTVAARAIAVADLNGDRDLDIVLVNRGNGYHQGDDRLQESTIYWGDRGEYSAASSTSLRTVYGIDVEIADVNQDHYPDILFANEGNGKDDSGAMIYLGNADGNFSEQRRIDLPGSNSTSIMAHDLNADGFVDIVLTNRSVKKVDMSDSGTVKEAHVVPSTIYWGSSRGFSATNRMELPTLEAIRSAAGDLDGNGYPDLVFVSGTGGVSFVYWNSAEGFQAHRRTQLVTEHSAYDCQIADLNKDGYLDLVVAIFARAGTWNCKSLIFWNGPDGITEKRRTELPTMGAMRIALADLNADGQRDIVFANKRSGIIDGQKTNSYIYWGATNERFSPSRRHILQATYADQYVNADFNHDGFNDLMFVQFASPSIFYWGGEKGLQLEKTKRPEIFASNSARTADFNRDGYLDLVLDLPGCLLYGQKNGFDEAHRFNFELPSGPCQVSVADWNNDGWIDVQFSLDRIDQVLICWNSPHGFDQQQRLVLPGKSPGAVETADLNDDGYLDLIVGNYSDQHKPAGSGEKLVLNRNPHTESTIYWGSADGFLSQQRTELPTIGVNDCTVADFNNDGHLDLAFTSYHGGVHRFFPTRIFINSSAGFDPQSYEEIPSQSGCGLLAGDFDRDGHQDLAITNHLQKGGDHSGTHVSVYWGNGKRFSEQRMAKLPATGPHFLSYADIGDIYRRSSRFSYLSPPFDAGKNARFRRISWNAETPHHTDIEFQIRTAESTDQLEWASWRGPHGVGSYFHFSGSELLGIAKAHRAIQYKATLISPNSTNTPVLRSVSLDYTLGN